MALAFRTCPDCGRRARLLVDALVDASTFAIVDYYRCDSCGEVWACDRDEPRLPPQRITRGRLRPYGGGQ